MAKPTDTRIANVLVKFQGHDWDNIFTVRSPTGNSIKLRCNGKWAKMSDGLRALINRYNNCQASEYLWGDWAIETMTYSQMTELKTLATSA